MTAENAVETAEHPILHSARGLHMVIEWAQLRGLPMPFVGRAYGLACRLPLELQFDTRDQVVTWAEALEVDVTDGEYTYRDRVHDTAQAAGELFDQPLQILASIPRSRP